MVSLPTDTRKPGPFAHGYCKLLNLIGLQRGMTILPSLPYLFLCLTQNQIHRASSVARGQEAALLLPAASTVVGGPPPHAAPPRRPSSICSPSPRASPSASSAGSAPPPPAGHGGIRRRPSSAANPGALGNKMEVQGLSEIFPPFTVIRGLSVLYL